MLGDYFASACSSKNIDFRLSYDGKPLEKNGLTMVMGEPDALEKVAFNFLSMTLKYTPLSLAWRRDLSNESGFFVKDSGPGITEEGQRKLFQVFSQVEESTTREYEGTGLGLALVKSLVDEMGGEVGVESAPGKGSLFFAELPQVKGVETKPLKPLLIIEDDEATMRMYREKLSAVEGLSGFDEASDYQTGMNLIIVVADGVLPGGDGADILAHIRQTSPDTRLVLLTGDDNQARFKTALSTLK